MSSEVDIFTRACNKVGGRSDIATVDEDSREAEVCRTWFTPVRDQVLRAAHWPCAKAFKRLALLATREEDVWVTGDPEPGYTYAYALPSDCLAPRYLTGFEPFSVSAYGDSKALHTNVVTPILCYTMRQTRIAQWDAGMEAAIVAALAAYICQPLTGKNTRSQALLQEANALITQARENEANVNNEFVSTVPDWISIRGAAVTVQNTRFFYPMGMLFSGGNIGG